jgi:hypothetical protein
MSKPKSYKDQNGCSNCKHCWSKWNPEYNELYCTKDVKRIPVNYLYPEDIVDEPRIERLGLTLDDWDDNFEEIELWEEEHTVREFGICDFYEEKK